MKKNYISVYLLKNNSFNENLVFEFCKLNKNRFYEIIAMLNNKCNDYVFINFNIVRAVCELLNVNLIRFIKFQLIEKYDKFINQKVTHVIYLFMKI